MITEELKKQVITAIQSNSTEVEVYSDECIHHADWTGPDEYKSYDKEIKLEVDGDGDINYTGEDLKDLSSGFYLVFEGEENFETEKGYIIENSDSSPEDLEDIIAIVSNENGDSFLIHENKIEDDCLEISNHIIDEMDSGELEFEEPDPPDPPDPWERDMMEPWY
jgi:hypothetical protein